MVFLKEGQSEGWHKLVAGGDSGNAVMGLIYVRVGPKLATLAEPPPREALNLDEAFPEFEAESAIRMEPSPPETMSLGRVFSLSVSLADVFRVRQFLISGGSARTQVIIGRGINGAPLEAICANCPAAFQRKKMRIEFEGGSYWRTRSADDAVAIAKLLLLAGAKHDARVVRWLYDNAANSQGKQALMRVLDAPLYPDSGVKKKKKKKPESTPSEGSPGWRSQAKEGPVKRQPSNLLLGGKRGQAKKSGNLTPEEEERRRFEEAQAALARPIKPIPLIPDEPEEDDKPRATHHHHNEDDSDDLEEESSEDDRIPADMPLPPAAVSAPQKRAAHPLPQAPVEEDGPEEGQGETLGQEEPNSGDSGDDSGPQDAGAGPTTENIEDLMSEIEQLGPEEPHNMRGSRVEDLLPMDVLSVDAVNESVIDWEGIETDAHFELGEDVSEAAEREKEKQWKRPPSMLFNITKKGELTTKK